MEQHWLQIRAYHMNEREGAFSGEPHRHRDPQWYCCAQGRLEVSIQNEVIYLEAGQQILIKPWRIRQIASSHKCTYLMLRFQSSCIQPNRWPEQAGNIPMTCSESYQSLLQQLSVGQRDKPSALTETLTLNLLLSSQQEFTEQYIQASSDLHFAETVVSKAEAFIDQHYNEPLDRESIAAAVHCSGVHLARLCKTQRKRTPHEMITDRRMHKARELLGQTSLRIAAIAGLIGYASASHFSQRFRETHGMSPLHFRRSGGRMWWSRKPQDGGPITINSSSNNI